MKLQRIRYLNGRTNETNEESPLYLVKVEQDYISYGKGTLAFNTLSHYLGETKMNNLIKSFMDEFSNNSNTYPTSLDFIHKLKQAVPDDLHYLITDMFENITFYVFLKYTLHVAKVFSTTNIPRRQVSLDMFPKCFSRLRCSGAEWFVADMANIGIDSCLLLISLPQCKLHNPLLNNLTAA